jgi:hypothetical protein
MQSIVEPPTSTVGPAVAKIGTQSRSVQAQSLCVMRALRVAGGARLRLMGWVDAEWNLAAANAEQHERTLIQGILAPAGS